MTEKILALIMAGGAGGRMEVLTDQRAKPTLPFAGVYRLIDFPLSHCVHSHISDVWIIEQFQAHTINDHLANGRPWDLDRTYGGLRVLQPQTGTPESGWHQGNADAIYRNRRFIREFAPDTIIVLSADHIYKLDYRAIIAAHHEHDADVTLVTTEVPVEDASRFGTVQVDADGRVTMFEYKPKHPKSGIVTTEVFVYRASTLLDTLDALVQAAESDQDDKESQDGEKETGLEDFGHQLLPQLVDTGRAYAYPLQGYWRDVGTIESFWQAHMDLLAPEPPIDLDEPSWPIRTIGIQRMPAHIFGTAAVDNSLIAPGCEIHGRVERSVLGPGVVVAAGAQVSNSVIFDNTVIGANAMVSYAIIDSHVQIGAGATIGGERTDEQGKPLFALVGTGAEIAAGVSVPPGAQVQAAKRT